MQTKQCPKCNFQIRNSVFKKHFNWCDGRGPRRKQPHPYAGKEGGWNKGLTKENNESIKKYGETYHQRVLEGKIIPYQKGKPLSEETKKKVSEKMKIAHAEGRAHNIGQSRWNNEQSYPEKFFSRVIHNEFKDKIYETEYPCGIYSLDFAWIHKKKYIEIDGDQHQRFPEYMARDKRKDEYAASIGWIGLRIVWKEMYREPKKWIQIAKNFIHS